MWAFLSHGNLSLISENFKLVNQRKVKSIRRPTNQRRAFWWSKSAEETQILGSRVIAAKLAVSSNRTEVYY
jgi:hypothetical protein